jgi:hypothetical protein
VPTFAYWKGISTRAGQMVCLTLPTFFPPRCRWPASGLCMLKNYPIADRTRPAAGTIDHAQWVSDRGPAALIEDRHDAALLPIVSEYALRRQ